MTGARGLATLSQALLAPQSALDSGGPYASAIRHLGILFFVLLGTIFLIVLALALLPVLRRHRGINQEPVEQTHRASPATEKRMAIVVSVASTVTLLILFGLVIVSVSVGKSISTPQNIAHALTVEIQGNQWWWYVRYANDDASQIIVTANEMHIPVDRTVMIRGTSNDVIHSFWIPGLQGKRDLIPSHVTTEWLEADQPGKFRGQCAEFCGTQHAHMAMWVVAEPEDRFEEWMKRQLQPASDPVDPELQRGQRVFLNSGCILCHGISGTDAHGQNGPDLTHFGSRLTIAAGTLPNNKGNLAGWIADPQTIKPGNHMATVPIPPTDLQPLVDYLESLQ
jgi:cytochrome c oxidase subunit 2